MSTPAVTPQSQTLAQMVRAKYPGAYDDVGDYQLEQKILAKYPQYKDMPQTKAADTGRIDNAPTGILPWLRNVEFDVRHGSQTTAVGRAMHAIGAQGLENGVGEGAANYTGGLPLGALEAAQGAAELPKHPWQGAKHIVGGALQASAMPLSFAGPEVGEAPQAVKALAEGAGEAATGTGNMLARILRAPATARQSQLRKPGSIRALPSFLQHYILPDWAVPKGEIGTATNPGVFAEIPVKVRPSNGLKSIAERDATRVNVPFAGEEQVPVEQVASSSMKRPLRPTVGTPEEFQVYDNQMSRLKKEASDAGTYSAARGKASKKVNYQQRIRDRM